MLENEPKKYENQPIRIPNESESEELSTHEKDIVEEEEERSFPNVIPHGHHVID
jgi:hypothetical protein